MRASSVSSTLVNLPPPNKEDIPARRDRCPQFLGSDRMGRTAASLGQALVALVDLAADRDVDVAVVGLPPDGDLVNARPADGGIAGLDEVAPFLKGLRPTSFRAAATAPSATASSPSAESTIRPPGRAPEKGSAPQRSG